MDKKDKKFMSLDEYEKYLETHPQPEPEKVEAETKPVKKMGTMKAAERMRRWRREHPEEAKAIKRAENLKSRHGITEEDYEKLLAGQGGRCLWSQNEPDKDEHLSVAHNRLTGAIVGLVCRKCVVSRKRIQSATKPYTLL
jgi:ferric-dicitrate binding protein FerR (iron transport regulator)